MGVKKWIVLWVLTVAAWAAMGQRVATGVVRDSASGRALEFVNVGIDGRPEGTATDAAGRYRLALPQGGGMVLRFSHTGYRPRLVALGEDSVGEVRCDVVLVQAAKTLDEVAISGERLTDDGFRGIRVEHLQASDGPGGGVEDLVKTLPDVNSSNEMSSQYSVRGGSFDENLVYINGVEVFRPMLIRSGQQEGMSIINPDLVSAVQFSPGGFDASFGDKMSSVLDIAYHRPAERRLTLSASLLGGSATWLMPFSDRLALATSLRYHSNSYLLRSMDTEGAYTSAYTDWQSMLYYRASERLNLGVLVIGSANSYGLVPESQTTAFSQRSMELDVYFDGAESDRFSTLLGAFTADYRPNEVWTLKANLAAQHIAESEEYHVQSQYWLYELGLGEAGGDVERFDRGVGTFLEHSRGRLQTAIYSANLAATRDAALGEWQLGGRVQYEAATDRRRHWLWMDSAGYAMPTTIPVAGDSANMPSAPMLQDFSNSSGGVSTLRGVAFVQRELNFSLGARRELRLLLGVRGGAYRTQQVWYDVKETLPTRVYADPRLSATLNPGWSTDLHFRLSAGGYSQPPLYREYRRSDGTLNAEVRPQRAWQAAATADWTLRVGAMPMRITGDLYAKYMPSIVPYVVDNLSLVYDPDMQARAYATGFCLRVNAELVDSLESWVSLHVMESRQDVEGDGLGWYPRPTDQRVSLKMFVQDYVPRIPWWRMSLTLVYATGAPLASNYAPKEQPLRFPAYFRIDWGNTVQLSRFGRIKQKLAGWHIDDVQLSLQVFNLFDRRNVSSYLWVADYDGRPYRVPSYLTARQLNLRLTVSF